MLELKPRKIRIVEENMRGYTGYIAGVHFTDGVSDDYVEYRRYQAIGANISIVDWEQKNERKTLTPAAESLLNRNLTTNDKIVSAFNDGTAFDSSAYTELVIRSREELEKIASEQGIQGVREIARLWGGTGRSIPDCIAYIISAQDKHEAAEREKSKIETEESLGEVVVKPEDEAEVPAEMPETVDASESVGENSETETSEKSE